ncbi:hypothetical protein P3T76_012274 [Phytophthora citrophthora]|uniref:RxLR effector protein n=1 Tax=Phytophthora citrophthora TaxID=4793 RepID=A0AAD9G5L0_9STRA|nr:hypothetical protein P3T76_012274 [Phytophthora citrophthora]
MRLLICFLAIVYTFVSIVDGNDQVSPTGISSPGAGSSRSTEHSSIYNKRNEKNLRSEEEDEERGILTKARLELWLKLGYSPEKAYKKLKLPLNIDDAYKFKNWEQMKQFYTMWLNKMAAQKPPTKM